MPTTQSEDPNERVDHPRAYNAHPSGIECIDLIEHLPANLACAVKYLWRCGLKQSETPLQELKKARWYTERERERIHLYDLDSDAPPRTDILWRGLARKVIASDPESTLAGYLDMLLNDSFNEMLAEIDAAIGVGEGTVRISAIVCDKCGAHVQAAALLRFFDVSGASRCTIDLCSACYESALKEFGKKSTIENVISELKERFQ